MPDYWVGHCRLFIVSEVAEDIAGKACEPPREYSKRAAKAGDVPLAERKSESADFFNCVILFSISRSLAIALRIGPDNGVWWQENSFQIANSMSWEEQPRIFPGPLFSLEFLVAPSICMNSAAADSDKGRITSDEQAYRSAPG